MAIRLLDYNYYTRLAQKIREGDQDAFAELYESTYDNMYRYVYYFLKDVDSVDDMLQEIYIIVYRNIGKLKMDNTLPLWMKQIAYHKCCDYIRSLQAEQENVASSLDDNLTLLNAVLDTDKDFRDVYDRDLSDQLHKALDQLPHNEQMAFLLRFENDLKLEEIADFMGVSLASAKRYIARARKSLQKSLAHLKVL